MFRNIKIKNENLSLILQINVPSLTTHAYFLRQFWQNDLFARGFNHCESKSKDMCFKL